MQNKKEYKKHTSFHCGDTVFTAALISHSAEKHASTTTPLRKTVYWMTVLNECGPCAGPTLTDLSGCFSFTEGKSG